MPIARFQMPDGKIARFEVPEGTTPEQAQTMMAAHFEQPKETPQAQPDQSWGDVAGKAISNIPSSVGNLVGGIAHSVAHPIDTARNLLDIGAGALRNAVPEGIRNVIDTADNPQQQQAAQEASKKAGLVGEFYGNRYGSEAGFKNAVATDPAGVMADAASILTGGGALATKAGLSKIGGGLSTAGGAVDPLALTIKGAGKAVDLAGSGVKNLLGTTTGAGSEAIKQAYIAGKEGGKKADTFQANMRGDAPMTDVLETAKSDLAKMNAAKTAEYRKNMAAVKADKQELPFTEIDKSLVDAYNMVTFKGQVKNDKGAEVLTKISDAIGDWKKLNPAEYHTPEGVDALKQVVGGIVESIPLEEKTARAVGNGVYNSIKQTIVKEAPSYADTMKSYSEASDQIKEVERALSLGQKASADTAMRKLQSLMRNNVNTNFGNRLKLAQELEKQGGEIMPALAGQALSSNLPRGIQGATSIPTAGVMYGAGGPVGAAASLLAGSPRLVGESTYYTGKLAGALRKGSSVGEKALMGQDPRILANLLYQMNQPKGQ